MKRFAIVAVMAAAVFAGSLYEQPTASADDDACKGGKCPLHDWMEKELQEPMDAGDLKKVAAGLEKLGGHVPDPKWNDGENGWAKLAKDGAAAAKAGDAKATGATCKSCHKAWRKEYKEKHRSKALK
jgi:cytochrome c556